MNFQKVKTSSGLCTCQPIAGVLVGDQPISEWVIWTLVSLAAATLVILIILGVWSWYVVVVDAVVVNFVVVVVFLLL